MARVLVTGMSGTGKSTVLAELQCRGHRVVDTDEPGWQQETALPDGSVDRRWHEERMDALLARHVALFVSGCVSNQGAFYDRFDAVVLLSLPLDVLLQRVEERTNNAYGKDSAEREQIVRDFQAVQPLLRRRATAEIDTRRPLDQVVDAVETLAREAGGGRGLRPIPEHPRRPSSLSSPGSTPPRCRSS